MDVAFVTARGAVALGVPRATAYRAVQSFRDQIGERILVVDGEVLADPDELAALLGSLITRAESAEHALEVAKQHHQRLEGDLQIARHELDLERGHAAATAPVLADIVAKVSQLLAQTLTRPGSELGPDR